MKKIIAPALVALAILIGFAVLPAQAFQNIGYDNSPASYTGGWWAQTSPGQHNVHWCYNANSYSQGAAAYAQAGVEQAAAEWNALSSATHVTLIQDANCAVLNNVLCSGYNNGVNTISLWYGIGTAEAYGQTCLKFADYKRIQEADVDLDFADIYDAAINHPGYNVSVKTVAMHEFGHMLGLGHYPTPANEPVDGTENIYSPCSVLAQIMCPGPSNAYPHPDQPGWDDIAGLLYIYTLRDGAGCGYDIGPRTPWYSGRQVAFPDVNADGGVGMTDVNLVNQYTGQAILANGGTAPNWADINGDGFVGLSTDVLAVLGKTGYACTLASP